MVNQEELAICRRRGHDLRPRVGDGFEPCPKCGMWIRDVITREEREEEPPEAELSRGFVTDRRLAALLAAEGNRNARKRDRPVERQSRIEGFKED